MIQMQETINELERVSNRRADKVEELLCELAEVKRITGFREGKNASG